MLIRTICKSWSGKPGVAARITDATNGDVFLFNARNINGITVRASTKSSFMFTERVGDPREKSSYVESEDTVANIKTRANLTWQDLFASLLVYPGNDTTLSPVTTLINCDSISYVYKDGRYPKTKSHVVYQEGGKLRDVIVAYSINQIYSLVDDGNLTTV